MRPSFVLGKFHVLSAYDYSTAVLILCCSGIKANSNNFMQINLNGRFCYQLILGMFVGVFLITACGRNREQPTPTPEPNAQTQLQPTFTPTGSRSVAQTQTEQRPTNGALSSAVAVATAIAAPIPNPTPAATLQADAQLALAQYQYRIGDYAAARTSLITLLNRSGTSAEVTATTQLLLARTYLAEEAYIEAHTALKAITQPVELVTENSSVDNAAVEAAQSVPVASVEITVTNGATTSSATNTTNAITTTTIASSIDSSQTNSTLPDNPLPDNSLIGALAIHDNVGAKAEFLRGIALRGIGEESQAIAAYWRFLEIYPWMAEFVQPRVGDAYLALGDSIGAAAAYRLAADAASDRVAKARLLEALAGIEADAGRERAAVNAYDEILALAQNPDYRAAIQYRVGQVLATAGDLPNAIARWQAATEEAPESGAAYLALVELVNREVGFDLYQRGYIDLQADALQPAINAFQAYIDSVNTTDSRIGAAHLGIGQAYLQAQNYVAALAAFDQVIANHPTCSCLGQAWLDKAATQAAQGEGVAARRSYRTFARDYPADPLAPEALWRSGILSLNENNRVEAAADLLRLADTFPDSERAAFALYIVGFGAYQGGFYEQSVMIYELLQEQYPDYSESGVAFWLGRAYQANGDDTNANAEWQALVERTPDSYYGILAAQAMRQLPLVAGNLLNAMSNIVGPATTLAADDGSRAFAEEWLMEWLQIDQTTFARLSATVAEDLDLRMGALLLELDQRAEGLIALGRLYERYKDEPQVLYLLSLAFEELGAFRLSIVSMARLLEFSPVRLVEDAPIFLQQKVYPRHFGDLITQEALAHKINPLLYFSLIRQESLFEEGARSFAAAQGLATNHPRYRAVDCRPPWASGLHQ